MDTAGPSGAPRSAAGQGPTAPGVYYPAIDFIKASAIVAVVLTHAARDFFDPRFSQTDRILGQVLPFFHVPSFLLVSGFLYCTPLPLDFRGLLRRLHRVLLPYLVASLVVQLIGLWPRKTWADAAFMLATASAIGIYYYIFLLTIYILGSWFMSRCSLRVLELVLLGLSAYAVLSAVWPGLAVRESVFWAVRDPLHTFGYFLTGWIARGRLPSVAPFARRHRRGLLLACVAGLLAYTAVSWKPPPLPFLGIWRAVYTLSVAGLLASLTSGMRAPRAVVYLSRTTYPLFLYHFIFIFWMRPVTARWPDLLRIGGNLAAGLAGGLLVAAVGSRLLGAWARPLLGVSNGEPRAAGRRSPPSIRP